MKSAYDGVVLENDRSLVYPLELDVYVPGLRLAVEINGTYWHGFHEHTPAALPDFLGRLEAKRLRCASFGVRLVTVDEHSYVADPGGWEAFLGSVLRGTDVVVGSLVDLRRYPGKNGTGVGYVFVRRGEVVSERSTDVGGEFFERVAAGETAVFDLGFDVLT